jgi:hypothetical protein
VKIKTVKRGENESSMPDKSFCRQELLTICPPGEIDLDFK